MCVPRASECRMRALYHSQSLQAGARRMEEMSKKLGGRDGGHLETGSSGGGHVVLCAEVCVCVGRESGRCCHHAPIVRHYDVQPAYITKIHLRCCREGPGGLQSSTTGLDTIHTISRHARRQAERQGNVLCRQGLAKENSMRAKETACGQKKEET